MERPLVALCDVAGHDVNAVTAAGAKRVANGIDNFIVICSPSSMQMSMVTMQEIIGRRT
jgi:hypothetical protein